MPRSKNHINIKNPCDLQWNSLTGSGCSKFCDTCSTKVVDLTMKSSFEIVDFVMKSDGRVCGRIRQDQVDRIIRTNRMNSTLIKTFLVFSLGFATITNPLATLAKSTQQTPGQLAKKQLKATITSTIATSPQDSILTLSGQILDVENKSTEVIT